MLRHLSMLNPTNKSIHKAGRVRAVPQLQRPASQPSACLTAWPTRRSPLIPRLHNRILCRNQNANASGSTSGEAVRASGTAAASQQAEDGDAEEGAVDDEDEEGGEWDEGEYDECEEGMEYEEDYEDEDELVGAGSTRAAAAPSASAPVPLVYNEDDFVDVGVITTPHGIRGEVKVRSLTFDPEERFCTRGNRLFLMPSTSFGKADGTPVRQVTVQHGRMMIAKAAECWVVKFKEVPTRNEAEQLRRWRLLMLEADRPSLEGTGEYYVTDLMGLDVFLEDGTEVGTVVDLLEGTGTYDTLRVELRPQPGQDASSRPGTVLVPFAEAFCPGVDLKARRMVITPPEGLLELASIPKERKPTRRGGRGKRNKQSPGQQQVPAA